MQIRRQRRWARSSILDTHIDTLRTSTAWQRRTLRSGFPRIPSWYQLTTWRPTLQHQPIMLKAVLLNDCKKSMKPQESNSTLQPCGSETKPSNPPRPETTSRWRKPQHCCSPKYEIIRVIINYQVIHFQTNMGKVHGSLTRAGKVRNQTAKVAKFERRCKPKTGRCKKRI